MMKIDSSHVEGFRDFVSCRPQSNVGADIDIEIKQITKGRVCFAVRRILGRKVLARFRGYVERTNLSHTNYYQACPGGVSSGTGQI